MSDKKPVSEIIMFNDRVAVKPDSEAEIGGIIIPDASREVTQRGIVVNCGPGKRQLIDREKRDPMQIKKGDRVMFVKFAGSEVLYEGEKYLWMPEEDILGVYEGGEKAVNIRPLNNRVLVCWEHAEDVFKGTNIARAPGAPMEQHYTGIVIAFGPDARDVQIGMRVFFNQFCGPERIDEDGMRFAFILDYDAYCEVPARAEMAVLSQ